MKYAPCLLGAVLVWLTGSLSAQSPRLLPEGQTPDDPRLAPLKDLKGYFPFEGSSRI